METGEQRQMKSLGTDGAEGARQPFNGINVA